MFWEVTHNPLRPLEHRQGRQEMNLALLVPSLINHHPFSPMLSDDLVPQLLLATTQTGYILQEIPCREL